MATEPCAQLPVTTECSMQTPVEQNAARKQKPQQHAIPSHTSTSQNHVQYNRDDSQPTCVTRATKGKYSVPSSASRQLEVSCVVSNCHLLLFCLLHSSTHRAIPERTTKLRQRAINYRQITPFRDVNGKTRLFSVFIFQISVVIQLSELGPKP